MPPEPWYDVAVVGAGLAGLAAAVTAAQAGCRVALLDSALQLGGQFDRAHPGWPEFAALRAELLDSHVDYTAGAAVWLAERTPAAYRLHLTGRPPVAAPQLVVATGAYDRVLPFPGWDLPGVVTLGAAQALRAGSGVAVGSRVVVAGAGPFLLTVALGLLAAGVTVAGVYEAGEPRRYARRPGPVAASRLAEAAGYAARLARHRVPYRTRHAVVAAHGTATVERVDVARLDRRGRPVPSTVRAVSCDAVAVGFGFSPQLELPLALGCATHLDVDGNLALEVDTAGRTSVPGVYAAGEVTGSGGAVLALTQGRLAGAAVALAAGWPSPFTEVELTRMLSRRAGQRRFARLLNQVHAPPARWPAWLAADTVICRCEEVPVAAVRAAVSEQGARDAPGVAALCRVGLGWCQGRMCGYAAATLIALQCGRELDPADLREFAHRPAATGHVEVTRPAEP